MKKIYISTIVAAVLSTGALAESKTIKDAFANGKVSGDISVYTENVNASGSTADSGFTVGSIGLNYETDSINGFKGALGLRINHELTEKEEGDFDNTTPKSVFNTAHLSYSTDKASITIGRQEIDLEWIGDFHEAVVAEVNYITDTTITIGHTERWMAADADGALEKMADSGSEDGTNFLDIKYSGIENTVINPYFMDTNDLGSAYGLKATTSVSNIDLTAHYAATSEDVAATEDGSIAHLEIGTTVSDISLAAGYITTDKNGGTGMIAGLGDNIDPFEDADKVYEADADTFYTSISTEISNITLGAFYGTTTYGTANDKVSEINLTAGVAISDELALDVLYSTVNAEISSEDTDKVFAMLTYSF